MPQCNNLGTPPPSHGRPISRHEMACTPLSSNTHPRSAMHASSTHGPIEHRGRPITAGHRRTQHTRTSVPWASSRGETATPP